MRLWLHGLLHDCTISDRYPEVDLSLLEDASFCPPGLCAARDRVMGRRVAAVFLAVSGRIQPNRKA